MKALKLFRRPDGYGLGYYPYLEEVDIAFGELVRKGIFPACLPSMVAGNRAPVPYAAREIGDNKRVESNNYTILATSFNGKYNETVAKHLYSLSPFTDGKPCVEYIHSTKEFKLTGNVIPNDTDPQAIIKVARAIFREKFDNDVNIVTASLGQLGDFVAQRDYIVSKGMPSCRSWEEFHAMDFLGKFPSEDFVFNDSLVGRVAGLHLINKTEFEEHFNNNDILKIPDNFAYSWFDYLPHMAEGKNSTKENCLFRGKIIGDEVVLIPNFGTAITSPDMLDKSIKNTKIEDKVKRINEGTTGTMLLDDVEANGIISISMYSKTKGKDDNVFIPYGVGVLSPPATESVPDNKRIRCRVAPPKLPLYNFTIRRTILTKDSTADDIRGALRIAKVKIGGRKSVITERLIDALHILYEKYDSDLTERLNGRKFLILGARDNRTNRRRRSTVWDGNEIVKSSTALDTQIDFPTFAEAYGSKKLDDTLLVMYLVRHLRGGSILDPSHVQNSYNGKELAHYVVMARDGYSSIPLLHAAVGPTQGYYYGTPSNTIDILELLKE
jgi:hypothetical protein